jgi:hypothetical protein
MKNQKICICTWYNDNIKDYGDITAELNLNYCKKYGYDYIIDDTRRLPERHPAWEKLPFCLELLPKYDYVIWIDADACFRHNNNKINIEKILRHNKFYDVIFSYDNPEYDQLNTGFFILKNTEYTNMFISEMIKDKWDLYYNKPNWEQEMIRKYYRENKYDIQNKSIILPFNKLQTFDTNENHDSLIIHMAGKPANIRFSIFQTIKYQYLPQNYKYILSISTIPSRIENLIKNLNQLYHLNCYKIVINICSYYKRFKKEYKLPKKYEKIFKTQDKVIFNYTNDNGPITKYIGGYEYMKKNKLNDYHLIIVDDDISYLDTLFNTIIEHKTKNNITTGSGFYMKNDYSYNIVERGKCEYVEGYAGICFHYNQIHDLILNYVKYYKCIKFDDPKGENLINKYLKASFMGDDYILSKTYKKKYCCAYGRELLRPFNYSLNDDALHKNNIFGSNLGTYKFLDENNKILKTFYNKINLHKQLLKNKK